MKRLSSIGLGLGCAAAAATLLGADPSLAQAPKPTAPPIGGPGSLDGVWNSAGFKDYRTGPPVGREPNMKDANGQPIPMLPWAAAIVAQRSKGAKDGEPYAGNSSTCLTGGMPGAAGTPAELPLQFVETPDLNQITVLFEFFTTFRIIHINQKHPDDPDPTFMGNSVGHWEGDTLVVDTIAITDKTNVMNLIPHTEDLHVVERIRRTGPDTMEDRLMIDDPKTFTKPWPMVVKFKHIPGMRLKEYICDNNRNNADANGHTTVQLQTSSQR